MQTHIRILAWLHIAWGALGTLFAILMFTLFGGIAGLIALFDQSGSGFVAIPVLGFVGTLIFGLIMVLSLPGLIIGIGLLQYRPWARVGMIILSVLHLLNFPIGTALGVYGLWALLSPEVTAAFETRVRATY